MCRRRDWPCPVQILPGNQWGGNATGEWDGIIRKIIDGEVFAQTTLFNFLPRAGGHKMGVAVSL